MRACVALVLCVVCGAHAGAQGPDRTRGESPAKARDATPATPTLDQYRRLWRALGTKADALTGAVAPGGPGLDVSRGGKAELERVRAGLAALTPQIDALAGLASSRPERVETLGEGGDARAQWARLHRVLEADARRLWSEGDADGAAGRAVAMARLGESMARAGAPGWAEGEGEDAVLRASLLLLGMRGAEHPPSGAALRAARDVFGPWAAFDAGAFAREWAAGARMRAAQARAAYAVPGGPAALADLIAREGRPPGRAAAEALAAGDSLSDTMGDAGTLIKRDPAAVRAMAPEQIAREIDAAEALIPKIQGVLGTSDPSLTLPQIGAALERAPSQVGKIVVGRPWETLHHRATREAAARRVVEGLR